MGSLFCKLLNWEVLQTFVGCQNFSALSFQGSFIAFLYYLFDFMGGVWVRLIIGTELPITSESALR